MSGFTGEAALLLQAHARQPQAVHRFDYAAVDEHHEDLHAVDASDLHVDGRREVAYPLILLRWLRVCMPVRSHLCVSVPTCVLSCQTIDWRHIDLELSLKNVAWKAVAHDFPLGKRQFKEGAALARVWLTAFARSVRADHNAISAGTPCT